MFSWRMVMSCLDGQCEIKSRKTIYARQSVHSVWEIWLPLHTLSGPDRSRHSSNQHPKDVNSENSNYCPIFVREFLSSRRQTPEVWNFCDFAVFEVFVPPTEKLPSLLGTEIPVFYLFVFCGLKLLRVCLKAPALTGYVRDAQYIQTSTPEQFLQCNSMQNDIHWCQDFHILLQDPGPWNWFLSPGCVTHHWFRHLPERVFRGFLKVFWRGFWRVLRLTPSKNPSKTRQRPLQKRFKNPSGVRGAL